MLKMTNIKLELLPNIDLFQLLKKECVVEYDTLQIDMKRPITSTWKVTIGRHPQSISHISIYQLVWLGYVPISTHRLAKYEEDSKR